MKEKSINKYFSKEFFLYIPPTMYFKAVTLKRASYVTFISGLQKLSWLTSKCIGCMVTTSNHSSERNLVSAKDNTILFTASTTIPSRVFCLTASCLGTTKLKYIKP
jgi:hypothetical protein